MKTITVRSCAECPYFVQTGLSLFAAFLHDPGKEPPMFGECDAPKESGLRHHPIGAAPTKDVEKNRDRQMKRMRVLDATKLPEGCPLRAEDVLVTLGS